MKDNIFGRKEFITFKIINPITFFYQEDNQQICNDGLFYQIYVLLRDWWHNKDIKKSVDGHM